MTVDVEAASQYEAMKTAREVFAEKLRKENNETLDIETVDLVEL